MENNGNIRYHLATSAECKRLGGNKLICPGCNHRTFVPYVDQAGQMLDASVGRCDRENSCTYHFKPREFFEQGGKKGTLPEGWKQPEPRKQLILPMQYVRQTKWKETDSNTLIDWLHSLSWGEQERNMLDIYIGLYGIGTYRNGETIFWLIDNDWLLRSGKIMRYLPNGHRDKGTPGSVSWVHSKMMSSGKIDPTKYEFVNCLYGEHLLKCFPRATVCIVESEKTALICSAFEDTDPKCIWLATGGLSHMNKNTFSVLRDRKVRFYPDVDGIPQWEEKVKGLHLPDALVWDIVKRQYDPNLYADNADIADIMIRKYNLMPETTSQKVHRILHLDKEYPAVTLLCDKLNLQAL